VHDPKELATTLCPTHFHIPSDFDIALLPISASGAYVASNSR
jgi:hypothetical protein